MFMDPNPTKILLAPRERNEHAALAPDGAKNDE
jgi:hypothetical protein